MPREAVRKFGVELEGYLNENLEGDSFFVNGTSWRIKEDGSLNDDTNYCTCDECGGSGNIENECSNSDCEDGEVELTDSDGNVYHCECKTCSGEGSDSVECEICEGEGRVERGKYGLEVISPPITDLDLITGVYEEMNRYDWSHDDDAGLHIHVDAEDLTPKDFYKILLLMTAVEPIMFAISDEFRLDECDYCFPLSECRYEIKSILERNFEEIERMSDVYFSDSRYQALNFEAYSKHGTVEFRYFSPQDSASGVIKRVELVTRLVDFAKYASYEQLYVAYKRIFDSTTFDAACDSLKELLELPFDLKSLKQSNESNVFRNVGRVHIDMQPVQVGEAV